MVGSRRSHQDASERGSVAEQVSWDIMTKEKALFETALDKENLSWEERLLDESGECHESETPNTMARLLNLEDEVNSPMNEMEMDSHGGLEVTIRQTE